MKINNSTFSLITSLLCIVLFIFSINLIFENHQLKKEKLSFERLSAVSATHLFRDIYYLKGLEEKIVNSKSQEEKNELLNIHNYLIQSYMYNADGVALVISHQKEIDEEYQKFDYSLREAFVKFNDASDDKDRKQALKEVNKAVDSLKFFVDDIYNILGIKEEII